MAKTSLPVGVSPTPHCGAPGPTARRDGQAQGRIRWEEPEWRGQRGRSPGSITMDNGDGSPTRKTHVTKNGEKGSLWEEQWNDPPFCSCHATWEVLILVPRITEGKWHWAWWVLASPPLSSNRRYHQ